VFLRLLLNLDRPSTSSLPNGHRLHSLWLIGSMITFRF